MVRFMCLEILSTRRLRLGVRLQFAIFRFGPPCALRNLFSRLSHVTVLCYSSEAAYYIKTVGLPINLFRCSISAPARRKARTFGYPATRGMLAGGTRRRATSRKRSGSRSPFAADLRMRSANSVRLVVARGSGGRQAGLPPASPSEERQFPYQNKPALRSPYSPP